MIDLGTLGGPDSLAFSLSEDGKVAGMSGDANNGAAHAFLWTPDAANGMTGTMQDLGTLGGTFSYGLSVNAAGQVTGISMGADESVRAFLWTPGATDGVPSNPQMRDLGVVAGNSSIGYGINEAGWVTGVSYATNSSHPFVWIPATSNGTTGVMFDMQTLGGSVAEAAAINTANQIVGLSFLTGNPTYDGSNWIIHAFVSAPLAGSFDQTITFGALADKTFGDADFSVSATASSGLAVSFAAEGSCNVDGTTVHLTGAGTCTITASQAGDGAHYPATDVPQSFDITKGLQAALTIGAPPSLTYGNNATLTSDGGSGSGTVSFSAGVSTGCAVTDDQLSVTSAAGTCSVTATKAGDDNYIAESSSAAPVALNKASATLSLSNLTQAFNGTPRSITVTTTPGGLGTVAVTYDGSLTAPMDAGSYAAVASLTNNNYQASNATGTLVITPVLKKVALNVAAVVGGANAVGTVTLNAKAPAGGVPVALSSSNTTAATVPAVVTVPAGAMAAQFTVTTGSVTDQSSAVISAVWGATKTDSLVVNPAALSSVTVNLKSVGGGGSVTGTVTLNGAAPAGGALVTLASSTSAAAVPADITIPAGQTSATFTIATTPVAANVKTSISATYNGVSKSAAVTVTK